LSELNIVVLKEEFENLPSDFYKIILTLEDMININPTSRTYILGKPFELTIEGKNLYVDPEKKVLSVGDVEVPLNDPVTYIQLVNGNVHWDNYSSIDTFIEEYGISGQNPKD